MLMNKEKQTKICAKCRQEKQPNDFGVSRLAKDGLTHNCKKCVSYYSTLPNAREYQKNQRNKEYNKQRSKKYLLKKKFNITLEEYTVILENQKHVCIICGKKNMNGKMLAVDHNHETLKVRGLLCSKCNIGLGQFNDDIDTLTKAISYLAKHNG